jgi:protein-S-isoprenylcysteine O-methyltransferase Ste14
MDFLSSKKISGRPCMIFNDTGIIFRLTAGLLLIMQTFARLWMTRHKSPSVNSRFYHKNREMFFVRLSGMAVVLAYLYVFLPDTPYFHFGVPTPLRWVGAGLMLIGNIFFIAAHNELGKQWSAELEIQSGHNLIDTGIYQFIRHPMYTGFLVFGLGLILLSANFFGCAYLPVVSVMIAFRLPAEEAMLLEVFGETYQKYQSRTSALFPGIF